MSDEDFQAIKAAFDQKASHLLDEAEMTAIPTPEDL